MSQHPTHLLSAFIDDELSATELSEVERHLHECRSCQLDRDGLAAVRTSLRELPMLDLPAGVVHMPGELVPFPMRWRRSLAAVAAVATLVVGVGVATAERSTPLVFDEVVEQHVARASVDPGFNVIQVEAVFSR